MITAIIALRLKGSSWWLIRTGDSRRAARIREVLENLSTTIGDRARRSHAANAANLVLLIVALLRLPILRLLFLLLLHFLLFRLFLLILFRLLPFNLLRLPPLLLLRLLPLLLLRLLVLSTAYSSPLAAYGFPFPGRSPAANLHAGQLL